MQAPTPDPERALFHESLHDALAQGRIPSPSCRLGPATRAALAVIAEEHPDATADHIAWAFDAFGREHAAPAQSA